MKLFFETTFWLAIALATSLAPSAAFAGEGDGGVDGGGGGGAITCKPPNPNQLQVVRVEVDGKVEYRYVKTGEIWPSPITNLKDVQLLDLWEADYGSGPFFLHPKKIDYKSQLTADAQIDRAMKRLAQVDPAFAKLVADTLVHVKAHVMNIPEGSYVLPPKDTRVRFLPRGCEIVGFGNYSDIDDNLVIDPVIKKQVTRTDFAGLFVHEAVYKALRDRDKAVDSWKARRIVGLMFSTEPFTKAELDNGF